MDGLGYYSISLGLRITERSFIHYRSTDKQRVDGRKLVGPTMNFFTGISNFIHEMGLLSSDRERR